MIVRNGCLLLSVNDPTPILESIPRAKYLRYKGHNIVAVPHKLDETHVLKNLGLKPPSPIRTQYSWPGRLKPRDSQIDMAEFITLNKRSFNLSEMRTGKTASALWAADYLLSIGAIDEVLVIAPLTVLKVWDDELFNIIPHRSAVRLTNIRSKRLEGLHSQAQFKIINFDGIVTIVEEMVEYYKDKKILVLVDEAATYRTYGTKRYKALVKLISPLAWLCMITGTPTPNAPTDAWALAKLVSPKNVPSSFKMFQEAVMRPAGPYKWVPRPGAKEMAFAALQPGIRFLRKDCFDIPDVSYLDRVADISPAQKEAYENLKRRMRYEDENSGIKITAANAAVKLAKLQQVLCGIVRDEFGALLYLDNKPRIDALKELIREAGGKCVVCVPFKATMHQLKEELSKEWRTEIVNGDVSEGKRGKIFDGFQKYDEWDVIVAHPEVVSLGVKLSACSTIIWYAPVYSLLYYEQANMRILDADQKDKCAIIHLGCHPLEWSIYEVLQKKSTMQGALLSLYGQEFNT